MVAILLQIRHHIDNRREWLLGGWMNSQLKQEVEKLKEQVDDLVQDNVSKNKALAALQQNYDIQQTIVKILEISLSPITLREQLVEILQLVLSIDWLTLTKKGCVFLVEEGKQLTLTAQVGLSEPLLSMCSKVQFGHCLCGKAAQTEQVVFKNCVDHEHQTRPEGMLPHGHYCLPIMSRGKVIGVLNLYVEHGHQACDLEKVFLAAVTNALAGIIERKKLEESLAKLSLTDPLTDLPNRRKVFDEVNKSIARAKRNKTKVAILFIDLDGFKPINDKYGHDFGDRVLKEVADRFSRALRQNDLVGRIGGDEFIVIAEDINGAEEVDKLSDRIKQQIKEPIQYRAIELVVNCSIGTSIYPSDSTQADELIEVADKKMYIEKMLKKGQEFA